MDRWQYIEDKVWSLWDDIWYGMIQHGTSAVSSMWELKWDIELPPWHVALSYMTWLVMAVFHHSTSDLCHRICQMSFLAAQETVEHWCPVLHKAEDLFILEPVINWTGFCCCLFQTLSDSLLGPFSSHVFSILWPRVYVSSHKTWACTAKMLQISSNFFPMPFIIHLRPVFPCTSSRAFRWGVQWDAQWSTHLLLGGHRSARIRGWSRGEQNQSMLEKTYLWRKFDSNFWVHLEKYSLGRTSHTVFPPTHQAWITKVWNQFPKIFAIMPRYWPLQRPIFGPRACSTSFSTSLSSWH